MIGGGARIRIAGIGTAVPERVVTNEEIAGLLGVEPSWIEVRTGIRERRYAGPDESPSTLGAEAARQALGVAGVAPEEVDLVVVATCTPDHVFPHTASLVQHRIGAARAGAFDLGAACSGFIYALAVASGMIAAGGARRVLAIGAEMLSRYVDMNDPITAPLFGDGAGAVLVEADPEAEPVRFELGADGGGAEFVLIPGGGSRMPPTHETVDRGMHVIKMSGKEVYRSAVRTMSALAEELGSDGFDWIIAHQANRRILRDCAANLGVGMEKVFLNIDRYGNTSAASIPIAMWEAWETGALQPGHRMLLIGFGSGYTFAGATLRWSLPNPRREVEAQAAPEAARVGSSPAG